MIIAKIKFTCVKDIIRFSELNEKSDCNIDVKSGKYLVDGTSLMGLFALDLFRGNTMVQIMGDSEKCEELYRSYRDAGINCNRISEGQAVA